MEPRQLEELLDKVGGKYKLVTLYQRRMRELQRGLPRLVDVDTQNLWETVATEIMDNKVELVLGEEADRMRKELAQREAEELAEAERKQLKPGGAAETPAPAPAAQ